MQFVKLRLAGFKSFVDPTELLIEPGLTGIVGPNGCGKSNLVEALRWVMGETSARRMRGEDMDDVIFGGTANRPPRNIAEVGLLLDNGRRTAPAGFNDADQLEVTRRIERGAGSDYRINGKLVRARDVQLLFADNASGANSPALVSQGRVGALISARPQDRRQLLEEAAGITGLHSRRHEAELRLKAAETNLTRLDDVIGTMEAQLQSLKKQARQAARYRNLSENIRRAEATLLHLKWLAAEAQQRAARAGFEKAEMAVRDLMVSASQLATRRAGDAAGLPQLRQAEAVAATVLQRLLVAREQLEAEERRIVQAQEANRRQLEQIARDLGREQALAEDADAALVRLDQERARLEAAQGDEEMLKEAAADALAEVRETVDDLDRELTCITGQVAADEARRTALDRQAGELESRAHALAGRLAEQQAQRAALEAEIAARPALEVAEAAVAAAEEALELARDRAEQAEHAKAEAEAAQGHARDAQQAAESRRARLKAEAAALSELLATGSDGRFAPLTDAVTVTPGHEGALAAALGDHLTAALDEAAPVHWHTLPPLERVAPLPAGVEPLTRWVGGPPAMARCLAHIGVVADDADGRALAPHLTPGQVLVSRTGAAWRWDGLTIATGAPTAAAVRLKQRNRLAELEEELTAAEAAAELARDAFETAKRIAGEAAARERQARDAVRDAFAVVNRTRDQHARLAQAAAAARSRLDGMIEAIERLENDCRDARGQCGQTRAALAALPDADAARHRLAELRTALSARRAQMTGHQNALDRLIREADGRRQRLAAIAAEERSWRARASGAGGRVQELEARAAAAQEELERLAGRPGEIGAECRDLLTRIADAERTRKRAGDVLAEAEARLAETEQQLKLSEELLVNAREARVRAEAAVASAMQAGETVRERIAERLNCAPETVREAAGLAEGDGLPDAAAIETRLERLIRERESMGPVNLRAEIEAAELETQAGSLQSERQDLSAAISRLRQGIASLNREARERLLTSFETVNRHFQTLFVNLFGGGKAHLELTNAEDPLDAGLEIYASPPGKRLQVLSLLSGGEQALTALSLLFAVFLTNPAPVCVLDEVDAPLDEANVERFCSLVDDMARKSGTRFLIITHHRLTMARVDRLFGVTMGERGISQLVSVDLQGAEALRGAA